MTEAQWAAVQAGDPTGGSIIAAQKKQEETRLQQNNLLQALQAQAAGQGPNPAQMMLQQATQQNNAQNAGFLASQKGINPAIAARLAAQNASASNQAAAGQGAIMNAQQQLSAQQQQAQLLNSMQTGNLGQEGYGFSQMNTDTDANAKKYVADQKSKSDLVGSLVGAGTAVATGGASLIPSAVKAALPSGSDVSVGAEGGDVSSMPKLHSFLDSLIGSDVGARLKSGGSVPGKPKHPGNDYRNDTVSAKLSPGEVVIPNSVMQSKDPAANAAKFVRAVMAKKGMKHV